MPSEPFSDGIEEGLRANARGPSLLLKKLLFAAALLLPAAAGVALILLAPYLAQRFGAGRTWDAPVYFREQFLFLGRCALFLAFLGPFFLWRRSKGVPLDRNVLDCALIAGSFLCIDSYCRREFWHDTLALALWLKSTSLRDLLLPGAPNPFCQAAPAGFIVLSKGIGTLFGFSRWALNVPVLLLALGTLWNFRRLAVKVLPASSAAAAAALFALNPGLWLYAGEFKQYTGDLFFTVTLLLFAAEFCASPEKGWLKLALTGAVGTFFSHAMLFLLPALGLGLLPRLEKKTLPAVAGIAAVWIVAVTCAGLYAMAAMPPDMYVHEHHIAGFAPPPDSWEHIAWYGRSFCAFFSAPWSLNWRISFLFVVPAALMIRGAVLLYRKFPAAVLGFAALMVMLFTASALHLYSVAPGFPFAKGRLILFTTPFALILLGGGITGLRSLAAGGVVLASCLLNCVFAFMPIGGFAPAVRELLRQTSRGAVVYVNGRTADYALRLYAPEGYFRKIVVFDPDAPEKFLPRMGKVCLFTVDKDPDSWKLPSFLKLRGPRRTFDFACVMTAQADPAPPPGQ